MDIYEVLNKIITDIHYYSMSILFTEESRVLLDEKYMPIYDLLKNISSLATQVDNKSITFSPKYVLADGKKSFDVEDITDDNFQMLENMDFNKIPLALKSLIADILWTQKKNYSASQIAANTYWEIFKQLYDRKANFKSLSPLRRTVCISIQTKSETLYSEIYKWFCDYLCSDIQNTNDSFSLRVMELFFEQKNTDTSLYLPALDLIISKNYKTDNMLTVEQAYELKEKCFIKSGNKKEANNSILTLAKYFYDYAERIFNNDSKEALRAEAFYEKAIQLFRKCGDTAQAEKIHRKLIEVQKLIPQNMRIIRTEYDISKVNDNINHNMDGLSFEECIIRLTQYVCFESIESLRNSTIEECKKNPLSSLFDSNIIDAQGKTVIKIPPLDDNEPYKDPQLLELHMLRAALKTQKIVGNLWISNILRYIRNKFSIDDTMLKFLVQNNCIIPEGRETIFQKGICKFLRGEFYEAMHILAPQMENLFRNIANEVGGITSTLSDEGLSQEKLLSSVFSLPELLDAYDNNIIFTFRGLLNEKAGANIRNKIGHGIIEESECASGECLYFGALVIRLLSYTSIPCMMLLHNSKKLKSFKMPDKNDIIIKLIHDDTD